MKKNLFVFVIFLVMISCQKDETFLSKEDSLYLKSASADEEKKVLSSGAEIHRVPNDVLVWVSASEKEAKVLNDSVLKIEDFQLLSNSQASFHVSDCGLIITINAKRLPFLSADYGKQEDSGNAIFNGILKTDDYTIAVDVAKEKLKVFCLANDSLVNARWSVSNGALTFKVGPKIIKIWLSKCTPFGNTFQTLSDGKQGLYYTLLSK